MLQQIFRFGIVGVGATLVHVSVFNLAAHLGYQAFVANILGYIPAFFLSYFGQSRWTFGAPNLSKAEHRRRFLRFILTSGLSFVLNAALVFLVVDVADLPPYAASRLC